MDVFLGKPEVDDIYDVRALPYSHQKIIGLYVSVQHMLFVNSLYSIDHLLSDLQSCFEGQSLPVVVEEVFQAGTQKVHKHDVIVSFSREGMNLDKKNSYFR